MPAPHSQSPEPLNWTLHHRAVSTRRSYKNTTIYSCDIYLEDHVAQLKVRNDDVLLVLHASHDSRRSVRIPFHLLGAIINALREVPRPTCDTGVPRLGKRS
jgi:hypothetical protein